MKPISIRASLFRMVGLAAIPVVLFSIAVGTWDAMNSRRAVERGVQDTARALSLAVDREIAAWRGALHALSVSTRIDQGDFAAFRAQAQEVSSRYGGWIAMIDRNGRQVINTLEPPGAALSRSSAEWVTEVFATGRPVVSDLFTESATERRIVAVSVPVFRAGEVRYALNLAIPPERIARILASQKLPAQWIGVVTDGNSRVLARERDHETHVGTLAPRWYADATQGADSGMLEGVLGDGVDVRLAYQRIPGIDWSVAVAVPESDFAAAWRTPLLSMTGAALLLLAATLGLSSLYARRIGNSVAGLLSGGGADPHPIREIEEARRLLRDRDREQHRSAEAEAARASAEAARASAEAANRSKDDFLATLSHELRTPLSAIMGWIAVIRARSGDPGTTQRALEVIERNAKHQAKLIDDLLDVSRIISGKLRLERAPVDFSQAIGEAIDAARPAANDRETALNASVEPGILVHGDYSRLVQIASNLLTNAIKFTPRHGTVNVSLQRADGSVRLTVRDNGRGIEPAALPHIFDRFAQAGSGQVVRPGLGLGLAIVHHLTELHGGSARAESGGAGRGATFTVLLPAIGPSHRAAGGHETSPGAAAAALAGVRVLVVDDHDDGRHWIAGLLSAHGARTAEATSAGEALKLGPEFDPHVIVSDIAMPGGDGYDLIRGVRARDNGHHTPVIALTALAGGEDRDRALREGFDAVIAKGSDPGEVVGAVVRLSGSMRA